MLGDELNQKVFAISVRSTEISFQLLDMAAKAFLSRDNTAKSTRKHGKQSLKELNKQSAELQDIPMDGKDVKLFEKELRQYGVDYAVKKDGNQMNTYTVFFKAKDISLIDNALKSYTSKQFTRENKPSIKQQMQKAVEKSALQKTELNKDKTKSIGAR